MTAFLLLGLGETAALFVTQGLGIGDAVVVQSGPLLFGIGGVYVAGGNSGGVYVAGGSDGGVIG